MMFRFDFRGDLDHLAVLKGLPLRPLAVAAGQLIAPLALLSAIDLGVIALLAFWFSANPAVMQIAAMAVVPFNLLLLGIENFFFLTFPLRLAGTGGLDFQQVGRGSVVLFARLIVLMIAAGISVGVAMLTSIITGPSPLPAALAGAVTLLCCGLATVPAVGWAFKRFDPAVDVPT